MTQQRYGVYCTLAQLKSALAEATTTNDTALLDVLEDVSRWLDEQCGGRFFGVESATKYYTAKDSSRLLLPDDLLSVTSLKTDEDDDYDYDYTWAATDYHLLPFNVFPKWEIRVKANGNYSFPSNERGVELAGLWGHGDGESATPYADSGTDTAEELDASEAAVDVASGAAVAVGQTILVESEQMFITGIATNTLTVVRGVNGTTAATHATAKDVYVYRYPRGIRRACLSLSQQTYRLESGPLGVIGSPEVAVSTMDPREYARLMGWLAPYRRLNIG